MQSQSKINTLAPFPQLYYNTIFYPDLPRTCCGQEFKSRHAAQRHRKNEHNAPTEIWEHQQPRCALCLRRYNDIDRMLQHALSCTSTESWPEISIEGHHIPAVKKSCCGSIFKTRVASANHARTEHDIALPDWVKLRFNCDSCHCTFKLIESFIQHQPCAKTIGDRRQERESNLMEFRSGRWSQFRGKTNIPIFIKTTKLECWSFSHNHASFSVVISKLDPHYDSLLKKFKRQRISAQGFFSLFSKDGEDTIVDCFKEITGIAAAEMKAIRQGVIELAPQLLTIIGATAQLCLATTKAQACAAALTFLGATSVELVTALMAYLNGPPALNRPPPRHNRPRAESDEKGTGWASIGTIMLVAVTVFGAPASVNSWASLVSLAKSSLSSPLRTMNDFLRLMKTVWTDVYPQVFSAVTGLPADPSAYLAESHEFKELIEGIRALDEPEATSRINSDSMLHRKIWLLQDKMDAMLLRCKGKESVQVAGLLKMYAAKLNKHVEAVARSGITRSGNRMEPLTVRLWGEPGAGKSQLMPLLAANVMRDHIKLQGNEKFAHHVYVRDCANDFWNNYNGQPVVIYDDLGAVTDSASKPNLEFQELISVVNVHPLNLPMAALEEKSKTFFRGELILLSSNKSHYATPSLTCPKALQRRLQMDVEVIRTGLPNPDLEIDTSCYKFFLKDIINGRRQECLNWQQLCTRVRSRYQDKKNLSASKCDFIEKVFASGELAARQERGHIYTDASERIQAQGINRDALLTKPQVLMMHLDPRVRKIIEDEPDDIVLPAEHFLPNITPELEAEFLKKWPELAEEERTWYKAASEYLKQGPLGKILLTLGVIALSAAAVKALTSLFNLLWSPLAPSIGETRSVADTDRPQQESVSEMRSVAATVRPKQESTSAPKEKAPKIRPKAEYSLDQQTASIAEMCVARSFRGAAGWYTAIGGRKLITNRHIWEDDARHSRLILKGVEEDIILIPSRVTACPHPKEDLVAIHVPDMREFKDITRHFVQLKDLSVTHVPVMLINKDISYGNGMIKKQPLEYDKGDEILVAARHVSYDLPTKRGDCGSIVMHGSNHVQRRILGVHCAGSALSGYGILLTAETLAECRPAAEHAYIKDVVPAHRNLRSTLRLSKIAHAVPHEGVPALLRPFDTPDGVVDPLDLAQDRYDLDRPKQPDYTRAMEIAESYVLRPSEIARVLTADEAVCGVGDMEPIGRNKSAGYPFCLDPQARGKRKWLGEGEERFIAPDLMAELEQTEQALLNGEAELPFLDCLKDEVRPLAKANRKDPLNVKTRLFSASNMVHTIMMRRYLGAFVNSLQEHRIQNGLTAGMNPHSIEWTQLAEHVLGASNQAFDGDWKSFDAGLDASLITCFFSLANRWYSTFDSECTEQDNYMRLQLAETCARSLHVVNGKMVKWKGGLPSGCYGTNQIDSISNLLIFIQAWLEEGLPGHDFPEHVRVVFHGDDNLFAVTPRYSNLYTPQTIANFGDRIGITYTPADKGDSEFKWKRLQECSFLKRSFLPVGSLWLAPLDIESCKKMCHWLHKQPDMLQATKVNAQTALEELSVDESTERRKLATTIRDAMRDAGKYVVIPNQKEYIATQILGLAKRNECPAPDNGLSESPLSTSEPLDYDRPTAEGTRTPNNQSTIYGSGTPGTGQQAEGPISGYGHGSTPIERPMQDRSKFGANDAKITPGVDSNAEGIVSLPEVPNETSDTRVETILFDDQVPPKVGQIAGGAGRFYDPVPEDYVHSIESFMGRPVQVDDIVWNTSAVPETFLATIDIPRFFRAMPSKTAKMQNFQFLRGTVVLRFATNAMQFHAGRLIVYFDPFQFSSGSSNRFQTLQYASGCSHIEVNPNAHDVVHLRIPFQGPIAYWDLVSNEMEMGSVNVMVLNQLRTSSNSDNVHISLSAWMEDVELKIPTSMPVRGMDTDTSRALFGARPQAQGEESVAKSSGVLSSVASGIGSVANVIGTAFPSLSHIAAPTAWIAHVTAGALRYFGLSKPSSYRAASNVMQTAGYSRSHMDGVSNAVSLTAAEDNALPVQALFGTEIDEMDISYVIARPCYLDSFEWSTSTLANTIIGRVAVFPGCSRPFTSLPSGETNYSPTLLAYVANAFKMWSGDIDYRVEIVSTNFHAGRMMISYIPGFDATSTAQGFNALANNFSWVVDISEGKEIDFTIPYMSNKPALYNLLDDRDMNYLVGKTANDVDFRRYFSNGSLEFTVLTPLVAADAAANSIEVNVWVSSKKMSFIHPSTSSVQPLVGGTQDPATFFNYPGGTPKPPPTREERPRAQGQETATPSQRYSVSNGMARNRPVVQVRSATNATRVHDGTPGVDTEGDIEKGADLVPRTSQMSILPHMAVSGELITNIRQLIKRQSAFCSIDAAYPLNTLVLDPEYFSSFLPGVSDTSLIFGKGVANRLFYPTFMDYFSWIYRYKRGSTRYILDTQANQVSAGLSEQTFVGHDPVIPFMKWSDEPYRPNGDTNPQALGHGFHYGRQPLAVVSQDGTRYLEVRVPQTCRTPISINRAQSTAQSAAGAKYVAPHSERQFCEIHFEYTQNTTSNSHVVVAKGAGDDFSFGGLVGPPLIRRLNPLYALSPIGNPVITPI